MRGTELDRLGRRALLRAAGLTGIVGLAGCGGLADRTVSASEIVVDTDAMAELGFERQTSRTLTDSASRDVGPVSGSVTAESRLTVFADEQSTPAPSERERWQASDTPLAAWAENDPVRGVSAMAAAEGDLVPSADDAQFESLPAERATLLFADTDDDTVAAGETLLTVAADEVDWGDRESDGTVTLEDPVPIVDADAFLPAGATLPDADG